MVSEFVKGSADGWSVAEDRTRDLLSATADFTEESVRLGEAVASVHLSLAEQLGSRESAFSAQTLIDRAHAIAELIPQVRERLPQTLQGADPDIWIEDKRLSLVVHARRSGDPAAALAAVEEPVSTLGGELGLEVHPGSGVLELRLPGIDKAGALGRLAEGRTAALYLGDDLGDLPAFDRIRELRDGGLPAWSVAVLESGVEGVGEAADVTVPDAVAAAELLRSLAAS